MKGRTVPAALAAALAVLIMAAAAAGPAFAHGLLMKLQPDGAAIVGELYYSSGRKAAGEWIEVQDIAAPEAPPVTVQTDPEGRFRVEAAEGRAYRVIARGEEGHSVTMELALAPRARPKLVDDPGEAPAAEADKPWRPPAWALIGGLLLLSIIPALALKRRSERQASKG